MRSTHLWCLCATVLIVVGCKGETGTSGQPGLKGDPGDTVVVASVDPGDACTNGGASLTASGVTAYACNGVVGSKGDAGLPGNSVTVASLGSGSACTHGGSQFTDGVATSYACNGAPGLPAPRAVAKASGVTVGQAFPAPPLSNGAKVIGIYVAPGAFALVDTSTGRSALWNYVYFAQPDCVGDVFVPASGGGPSEWGQSYAVEAYGTTRVFAPTSGAAVNFYSQSRLEPNPVTGAPMCQVSYSSGTIPGYAAVEVLSPAFPLALPISLALE
jgi:hypothetical protein